MSSIRKNYIYNTVYQLLNILLPFITVPIISRALGPDASGVYSYTYSIVSYFMIFGMLGISNYGNRKIAKSRDDSKKLAKAFRSIYTLQLIFNGTMLAFYLLYSFMIAQYKAISLVETFFIISNILDISWLYFGLEEFKKPVTRNILIKLLALILIVLFIKSPDDLLAYTAIMSLSTALSQLLLWFGINKFINLKAANTTKAEIRSNIKGILLLFIPVISYSIYKMMDIIMLGIQSDMSEVGYYQYAEKIVGIPLGFISALGTVMLPRASNLISKKDVSKTKDYIYKSLRFIMFFTIPCIFGLIAISNQFSTVFLGNEYARTGTILIYLATTLFFTAWATVVRTQWLIPTEKDKVYIYTTIAGAVINFIINMALIPILGGVGAAIGTIVSEFIIMFTQSFIVRKQLQFSVVIKPVLTYLFAGGLMLLILMFGVDAIVFDRMANIIAKIILGAMIYFGLNYHYVKSEFGGRLRNREISSPKH